MDASPRATGRTAARAAVLDVVSVVVFVAVGRRSHDEGGNVVVETVKVAAPFLIALTVGWIALRAWRRPAALVTGVGIWVITVALGMLVRRTVFDRGTAASFVVVASIATGVLLLGWRAVSARAGATHRGRSRRSAPGRA